MASIDLELLRHALTVAKETGLHEVEVTAHGTTFQGIIDPKSAKKPKQKASLPAESQEDPLPTLLPIKSTAVGIFRIEEKLAIGNSLKKGDKVGAIIALGISNDVLSTVTGRIEEVLIEENGIVEYGQVLARVLED